MTADLTLEELRALFLFEALEEDQLTFARDGLGGRVRRRADRVP